MIKTITLDLDDTIADLRSILSPALHAHTGKALHWNEWYQFDLISLYDMKVQDFFDCIIHNELLEKITPYPETKPLLTDLKKAGYTIKVITSRGYHKNAQEITEEWFAKYHIPVDQVIITSHNLRKCDYVQKEENVAIFVDDRYENCEDFLKSGKTDKAFVFDMPWNQCSTLPRIKNLNEIRSILNM